MAGSRATGDSMAGNGELTAEEARLARAAASGDGAAFATIYDRYESRIFNFCHRLLGSPDDAADATQEAFLGVLQRLPKLADRDLNFSAYLFTAARNASYDMIGRRKRMEPVDVVPEPGGDTREPGYVGEDPERAALLADARADVRAANGRLAERQREVLALRELEELSYDEIGAIMGMNQNSVAQLISRARIKLRDELRGSALAAVAISSPECERALAAVAMHEDGQLSDEHERAWLDAHLAVCDTCRVSKEAMEEAGASYRAWLPLAPFVWLREATFARAAELVGADWSAFGGERSDPEGVQADAQTAVLRGARAWRTQSRVPRRLKLAGLGLLIVILGLLAGLAAGGGLSIPGRPASGGATEQAAPGATGATDARSTLPAPASTPSGEGDTGDHTAGSEAETDVEGGDEEEPPQPSGSTTPSPETPADEGSTLPNNGGGGSTLPDDEESTPPPTGQGTPPP